MTIVFLVQWLKSLKDRVQPQPKQEWSEEDEQNSAFIVAALDAYNRLRKGNNNSAGQEEFDRAVNWIHHRFKSLHPQSKQEWSEKDEKIYNEIINFFLGDIETRCATIDKQRSFGYWLKSLKPNHWKPSEKEMEDLYCAAKQLSVTRPYLKTLYEHLKKTL